MSPLSETMESLEEAEPQNKHGYSYPFCLKMCILTDESETTKQIRSFKLSKMKFIIFMLGLLFLPLEIVTSQEDLESAGVKI